MAARGLMALDQLLFDPEAAPVEAGSYRCRLLVAITGDMAATTRADARRAGATPGAAS